MRIMHFALSCFYIEGYTYQENVLPTIHAQMGHDVLMVASRVSFDKNGSPCLIQPSHYYSKDGFEVIRVPYKKFFSKGILRRIRIYSGVYNIIENFKPDIMYFHGCSALELNTIIKYKKAHPEVTLFLDNHADRNNSASSKLSLVVQHKMLYKWALKRALPYVEKLLCPSIECMDFCRDIYGVPEEMLEFYPLGGTLVSAAERRSIRTEIRKMESISDSNIAFTHSGKMDAKKRTLDIIHAFKSVKNPRFTLWIIGALMEDVKIQVLKEIKTDERIHFLGWKESNDLLRYLCASDVYVQPGGQSATMQNAMCCGCAVMLYPHKSHKPYVQGNGYYISTIDDMKQVFSDLSSHPEKIETLKNRSYEIACDLLDYNKLAQRVCIPNHLERHV